MRIGIDFGGHTITAARFEESCMDRLAITQRAGAETPHGRSAEACFDEIARMTASLCGGETPELVGLAMPSMLDADRRHSRKMPNFPAEWDDIDAHGHLARALERHGVRAPIMIENDANCYAVGEGIAGAARGMSDYVVFTMGTGIGCGIVSGGKLVIGAHGMAGEGGHSVIGGDAPCGCGGMGHVETIAASDGTCARAEAAGLPSDFKSLWALRGSDARADTVLDGTIRAMAMASVSAIHFLDPEAVIIGGGMSAASGIVEAIDSAAMPYLSRPFRRAGIIIRSKLGNEAALYGAASLSSALGARA